MSLMPRTACSSVQSARHPLLTDNVSEGGSKHCHEAYAFDHHIIDEPGAVLCGQPKFDLILVAFDGRNFCANDID